MDRIVTPNIAKVNDYIVTDNGEVAKVISVDAKELKVRLMSGKIETVRK